MRILKIIPFLLFTICLLFPISLHIFNIKLFLFFYFIVLLYSLYKLVIFIVFSLVGFIKFRTHKSAITTEVPYQIILIATFLEGKDILLRTLRSINNQNYSKDKIKIFISFESAGINNAEIKKLYEEIDKLKEFELLSIYKCVHEIQDPNLEVPGAASNRTCVAKFAQEILTLSNIDLRNCIATIPDADTVFGQNYFIDLSNKWLSEKNRNNIFILPAIYKFNNNFKDLYSFEKVIVTSISLSILSSSTYKPKSRYTFSCFSLTFQTLVDVEFWDTTIAVDDTPFFWRAFNKLNGEFECRVIFSEISVNAVYNKNLILNIYEQYVQFYRWGLGVIAFPLAIKTLFTNKKINIFKRISKFIRLIETFILIKVSFVIILICILLSSNLEAETLSVHNKILKILVTLSFLIIPIKTLIIPRPKNLKQFLYYLPSLGFEIPLGLINLIFFSFVPYFHAAMNMAIFKNLFHNIRWAKKLN